VCEGRDTVAEQANRGAAWARHPGTDEDTGL